MDFHKTIALSFYGIKDFQNFQVLFPISQKSIWKVRDSGLYFFDRIVIGTSWYSDGKKSSERYYKNRVFEGPNTTWYKNGEIESISFYHNGNLEGISTKNDIHGMKRSKITYKNDKKEGLATFWYSNGQKEAEGRYKNNTEDDLWHFWREDGTPYDDNVFGTWFPDIFNN